MAGRRRILDPSGSAEHGQLSPREKSIRHACETALGDIEDLERGDKRMTHPIVGVMHDFLVMVRDALKEEE